MILTENSQGVGEHIKSADPQSELTNESSGIKERLEAVEKKWSTISGMTPMILGIGLLAAVFAYSNVYESSRKVASQQAEFAASKAVEDFVKSDAFTQQIKLISAEVEAKAKNSLKEIQDKLTASVEATEKVEKPHPEVQTKVDDFEKWRSDHENLMVRTLDKQSSAEPASLENIEWNLVPKMESEIELSAPRMVLITFHSGPLMITEAARKPPATNSVEQTLVFFALSIDDNRRAFSSEVKGTLGKFGADLLWAGQLEQGKHQIKIQWKKQWSHLVSPTAPNFARDSIVKLLDQAEADKGDFKLFPAGRSLEIVQFPTGDTAK